MSLIYHTQAIVLKKQDFGEYNNLYVLYTRDLGKVPAVCRGSKKITSKLAGHLEPFAVCDAVLVKGKNFFQIIGTSHARTFNKILLNYQKILYASFCFEVTDNLIKEFEKDERAYNLLLTALEAIDKNDTNLSVISHSFAFQLIHFLGFTPQTHTCIRCNKDITKEGNSYCVYEGGIVCEICSPKVEKELIKICSDNINILRLLSEFKMPLIDSIKISEDIAGEFEYIVRSIIQYYVEKNLRTEKFFI